MSGGEFDRAGGAHGDDDEFSFDPAVAAVLDLIIRDAESRPLTEQQRANLRRLLTEGDGI
jgi:hypothetical protein